MTTGPDVLVLGGGGILGEAWMTGYLAGRGQADGVDFRDARHFVGTSAGSIVSAFLAAGVEPRRPRSGSAPPAEARVEDVEDVGLAVQRFVGALSALAGPGLSLTRTGGAAARAAILARIPRGTTRLSDLYERVQALGLSFDGRLRVAVVDRLSGRRVVLGSSGAPDASVADAVLASCAIPGVFAPVTIGGREYVDGGVWSPTNLDAAPAGRGDDVLCLVPTASISRTPVAAMRALGAGWRMATSIEAAALRRRGAHVTVVAPDAPAAAVMGASLMDPGPRHRVLAEGFRQGLGGAEVADVAARGV